MYTLGYLLFDIKYVNFSGLLAKLAFLVFMSTLVIWLIQFILVKTARAQVLKRVNIPFDYYIQLVFLSSLFLYMVLVFNPYLFVLFKTVGLHQFRWTRWDFYLDILPQILLFISVVVLFMVKYTQCVKSIRSRS